MIRVLCPICGQTANVADADAGKTEKCNRGELLRIPVIRTAEQPIKEKRPTAVARGWPGSPSPSEQVPSPRTQITSLRGEMIFCYVCRKQIADSAPTCPKCGAMQTAEGREKGRLLKKQANLLTTVVVCLLGLPIAACCLGGMFGGNHSNPPPRWDKEQFEQDVNEIVRDPQQNDRHTLRRQSAQSGA